MLRTAVSTEEERTVFLNVLIEDQHKRETTTITTEKETVYFRS
jgi:hypothetical protein